MIHGSSADVGDRLTEDTAGEQQSEQAVPKRSVIGIGGGRHYTLYDPATDHIEFRIAGEPSNALGRGFG